MLTQVRAGPFSVRGVSVGGVYTSLQVPELSAVLDAGMALKSFAGSDRLFLSHGHLDHAGALGALLGLRALMRKSKPLRVFCPTESAADLSAAVTAMSRLQRHDLPTEVIGMEPGDEQPLGADLWVRAVRTLHRVPSRGYQFFRRVKKLRPEHASLPGPEIGRRRRAGEDLFSVEERHELAYATDTLPEVLDREPALTSARVLILECTFLDDKKPVSVARAGCHIHLDDLIARADRFAGVEHLVLMHFSQIYSPAEVRRILASRCPPNLRERVIAFAPRTRSWPG